MHVVDVPACGASATNAGNGVLLGVVAGVATALCPDPLIELQLVRELNASFNLKRDAICANRDTFSANYTLWYLTRTRSWLMQESLTHLLLEPTDDD
jgi:hypothetical protein